MNKERNIISFDIESSEIIDENPDSRFMTVKIQAFSSGLNLHNMTCSEEDLKKTAPTIYDVPIIYNLTKFGGSFGSHTSPEDSLICGFVVPDTAEFERLPDQRLSLMVKSKISKMYCPDVVSVLKKEEGFSKVSVEMELVDRDESVSPTIMKNWIYMGICLLGDHITEASPLAHLEVLSFSESNKKIREEYMEEFSNKYIDIDFTIPKELKSAAKKSLDTYKSSGESANSASLAMGRFIINNEKITVDKLRSMAKYFNGKTERTDIAIGFYGGRFASKWSKEMINKINEIDEKRLSYFNDSEVLTFPYKNIGDAPPSIQKLDGVALTAIQASEIAAQADKIGGEYAWPTAIKSWKSRHKIDNDHWVKKENSTEKEEKFVNEDNEKLEEMAEIPVENKDKTEVEMSDEKPVEEMAKEDVKPEEKEGSEEKPKDKDGEEPKEEKMSSLDQNIDIAALLQMLVEETEDNKILAEKYKAGEEMDYSILCSAMYKKMCKMQSDLNAAKEDKDVYMSENVKLKEYKDTIEKQQFSCAVEKTLQEVSDSLSKEEINNARETAKSLNLDTLTAWQNDIRSLAFSYIKNNSKKKESFTRMATVNSWLTKNDEPEDAVKKYAQNGWL